MVSGLEKTVSQHGGLLADGQEKGLAREGELGGLRGCVGSVGSLLWRRLKRCLRGLVLRVLAGLCL